MNDFCLVVYRTLCVAWHVLLVWLSEKICFFFFLLVTGTSLVAQWLRIRLAVQGTQVQSLVGN